jgi:hypothetical protein
MVGGEEETLAAMSSSVVELSSYLEGSKDGGRKEG